MSSNIVTSNGLKLVYTGEFLNDPAADTAVDLATNFNTNTEYLDTLVTRVTLLEPLAQVVEDSGLSAKFLNGGSF
jgi:hypothetical protein